MRKKIFSQKGLKKMLEIILKNFKNNRREWWLYEDKKPLLGFDKLSDLREHFKDSLEIDKNKKVRLKDEDKFLTDLIFI